MQEHGSSNPGLTVALALAAGIVAQSLAQHLRIPGIVILLAVGVLLGPDVLGVVHPAELGEAIHVLVGFAVAVILFEGGLNLRWRHLRREAGTIQRLISLGAAITTIGGTLAAHYILGWDWHISLLFGTLVIVTGPTVITPILRRIKVKRNVETILEAEGVFIDAVGAIVAVVVLEVVLRPTGQNVAIGFASVPTRLLLGAVFGVIGGFVLNFLMRFRGLIPEGLANVFTLAMALAIFQASNALQPESGIVSVIVAGLVVGNFGNNTQQDLREFKEQLTVLLIGMLFVLLAADVRLAQVAALGWSGVMVVLALMLVVRPVGVLACTIGSGLSWKEKLFLSWLAPRGIVAAAVATLFYDRMREYEMAGGEELRALVFMVIAISVIVQGLSGGAVAKVLGLQSPGTGYMILGAGRVAQALARVLGKAGEDVVLADANPDVCSDAQANGFRVIMGNALEERVQRAAHLDSRRGAIALLSNEAVNLLFVRMCHNEHKVPRNYAAIQRGHGQIEAKMVHEAGATVLFGSVTDIPMWDVRLRRKMAESLPYRLEGDGRAEDGDFWSDRDSFNMLLSVACERDGAAFPVDDRTRAREGDVVHWLVFTERQAEAESWLRTRGWVPVEATQPTSSS